MIDIHKIDWEVARIGGGWTVFDRETLECNAHMPVTLSMYSKAHELSGGGAVVALIPRAEFDQFTNSTKVPDHKCCVARNRIQWLPAILFDIGGGRAGQNQLDLYVTVWLHPDLVALLRSQAAALASFVPSIFAHEAPRSISAREMMRAADSRLDQASQHHFWHLGGCDER